MKPLWLLALLTLLRVPTLSAQSSTPALRFGLLADIQYADANAAGSRFYRNSLGKAEEAVAALNRNDVAFTINLGDIVDRRFADIDSVLLRLSPLRRKLYNTTGNHDYKGVTDNRRLLRKLGMPAAYYTFEKAGWVFVMLNTNEVAPYANVAGTPLAEELSAQRAYIKREGLPQGASYNGGVSAHQLEWLDKVLRRAERKGKRVLVFSHHPLYPEMGESALNAREILSVIARHTCVKALFAGHHHAGGFARYNGIPSVNIEGMVETAARNAFAVVTLYPDRIEIEGHGRVPSRTLPVK
ncbi:MAG: metallophosphoesterase [Mediterranea sp.]|jgi:3',5'-cyclic AMP phosphodiesterase CpdA|nr:metallophosphoesterase [Mediterranea sp.]